MIAVFTILLVLLALGSEIGIALAAAAFIALVALKHPLYESAIFSWDITNSFTLTALPLCIFMGNIFLYSGVSDGLFTAVKKWLSWLPGGLACSVVGACAIFAAISGSSPATAATIGTVALPEMIKEGYAKRLTYGVIAAGGTLGILIPPSITMIIYGSWQNVSIAELFAGGIIPGILLAILFILTVILAVLWWPQLAPKRSSYTWNERFVALGQIAPWTILILLILGGIFAGIMTPTEAAAVGALTSVVFTVIYRRFSLKVLKQSSLDTVKVTCMILFIIAMARVLAFYVHYVGLGKMVATGLLDLQLSKYLVLIAIYIMYLVLGCFFETASMIVLTLPFIAPILTGLNIDMVWFGVVLVVLMEAGMITPPVGMNLFVIQGIAKEDLMEVSIAAAPFLLPMAVLIAVMTIWPQTVLWLPKIMVG